MKVLEMVNSQNVVLNDNKVCFEVSDSEHETLTADNMAKYLDREIFEWSVYANEKGQLVMLLSLVFEG